MQTKRRRTAVCLSSVTHRCPKAEGVGYKVVEGDYVIKGNQLVQQMISTHGFIQKEFLFRRTFPWQRRKWFLDSP